MAVTGVQMAVLLLMLGSEAGAQSYIMPTPPGGDRLVRGAFDVQYTDCSPGPCPPPPPDHAIIDSIGIHQINMCAPWLTGYGTPSGSSDPSGWSVLYQCDGDRALLFTAYSDANCTNKMKYSDYWKTMAGPTAKPPPNLEFPIRWSPNSWLDNGHASIQGTSQTGRVLSQFSWFQGCSEQMLVFNSTTYAYNHASFTTQTMSSPALPNSLFVSGECAQLWLPSKDPKIDTMSMGLTYECDGPTGLNVTVYKDSNCFVTGSAADFYRGGFGTGFKPSDSLIKAGASHTLSAGKPFILGTMDGVTMATKIDEVHGCKSTPPRPSPPPPPQD